MMAANRRFEPKRIMGIPLLAAAGGVSALTAWVLAMLLAGVARGLFLLLGFLGLAMFLLGARYGDDLAFIGVRLQARGERRTRNALGWVRQ
ncbi:MAG TPA: hypothetical protein VFN52_07055 [Acidiferrobacteraceae bacterium]|nr:hypothetical protein [Acidiferrobacteraceae bacterium]